jgi:hypothetical protein
MIDTSTKMALNSPNIAREFACCRSHDRTQRPLAAHSVDGRMRSIAAFPRRTTTLFDFSQNFLAVCQVDSSVRLKRIVMLTSETRQCSRIIGLLSLSIILSYWKIIDSSESSSSNLRLGSNCKFSDKYAKLQARKAPKQHLLHQAIAATCFVVFHDAEYHLWLQSQLCPLHRTSCRASLVCRRKRHLTVFACCRYRYAVTASGCRRGQTRTRCDRESVATGHV